MSQITFCYENVDFRLWENNNLALWIGDCVEKEGNRIDNINFIFCSDEYLYKMNKKYLKHETFTDVITFDYSDKEGISGDVFISIDRVQENSEKFEQSFESELARVMIHGVLHLIGYKDKKEEEAKVMRQKENYYLSKLDVSRETKHLQ